MIIQNKFVKQGVLYDCTLTNGIKLTCHPIVAGEVNLFGFTHHPRNSDGRDRFLAWASAKARSMERIAWMSWAKAGELVKGGELKKGDEGGSRWLQQRYHFNDPASSSGHALIR